MGYYGGQVMFDPANASVISGPSSIDVGNRLSAIACPSVTQCVSVDEVGNEFSTTNTLTVSLSGSGSGSVTGSRVSCPVTCSASYDTGATVTLAANAASGSSFSGWSGGGCSGTGACTVTVSSDQAVSATFSATPLLPASPPVSPPVATRASVRSVTVRGAVVSEVVDCTSSPSGSCALSITLTVTEITQGGRLVGVAASKKSKTARRTVTVGSETLAVKAGGSATAQLTLDRVGKRLLATRQKLAAELTTTLADGKLVSKRTVTFKRGHRKTPRGR